MKIKLLTGIAGQHNDVGFSFGYGQEVDASEIGLDYAKNLCTSGQAEEVATAPASKPKSKPAKSKVDDSAAPSN